MLDAAVVAAFKDQRTRLEKLRDDVDSNRLLIPLGLCGAKSEDAFNRFVQNWNKPANGLTLRSFCPTGAYTEVVEHESQQMWNLLLPFNWNSYCRKDGWHMVLSRSWMMTGGTSTSQSIVERNDHALARYREIERELSRLIEHPPFNSGGWTSTLFDMAFEGKLAGISLKKEFYVTYSDDGRAKDDIEESDHWFAVIPNAAHYSIRAIDRLIANGFDDFSSKPTVQVQLKPSAHSSSMVQTPLKPMSSWTNTLILPWTFTGRVEADSKDFTASLKRIATALGNVDGRRSTPRFNDEVFLRSDLAVILEESERIAGVRPSDFARFRRCSPGLVRLPWKTYGCWHEAAHDVSLRSFLWVSNCKNPYTERQSRTRDQIEALTDIPRKCRIAARLASRFHANLLRAWEFNDVDWSEVISGLNWEADHVEHPTQSDKAIPTGDLETPVVTATGGQTTSPVNGASRWNQSSWDPKFNRVAKRWATMRTMQKTVLGLILESNGEILLSALANDSQVNWLAPYTDAWQSIKQRINDKLLGTGWMLETPSNKATLVKRRRKRDSKSTAKRQGNDRQKSS
jgi:hypothetical protein